MKPRPVRLMDTTVPTSCSLAIRQKAGSEATYGEFRVRCASEETTAHANVIRELWFSSTQGDSSDERRVVQLQTTTWPNYGVPEETGGIRG